MQIRKKDKIIFKINTNKNKFKRRPVLFLDRDGVIIEDRHYINNPREVELCAGVKKFIRRIYEMNIPIVIITNQSGISKNIITWEEYNLVTNMMLSKLEKPNPITAIYANSYISDIPKNNWRKPNPSMILQSVKDLDLDLKNSILVGDRKSDLIAGIRSGVRYLIHVQTGYGSKEKKEIKEEFDKNQILEKSQTSKIFFISNLNEFPYEILL